MADGDPAFRPNLKAILVTIAEAAPMLRAKGVVGRVEIPGVVSFEVAAPEPMPPDDDDDEDEKEIDDPLADPETFGGRKPPTFDRSEDET